MSICLCTTEEKCEAPCTDEQFTCENGCCLDEGLECDETPQCSDGSDEKKCDDRMLLLCKLELVFIITNFNRYFDYNVFWIIFFRIIANMNYLLRLSVQTKFRILMSIPVDEQKGVLNFSFSVIAADILPSSSPTDLLYFFLNVFLIFRRLMLLHFVLKSYSL